MEKDDSRMSVKPEAVPRASAGSLTSGESNFPRPRMKLFSMDGNFSKKKLREEWALNVPQLRMVDQVITEVILEKRSCVSHTAGGKGKHYVGNIIRRKRYSSNRSVCTCGFNKIKGSKDLLSTRRRECTVNRTQQTTVLCRVASMFNRPHASKRT